MTIRSYFHRSYIPDTRELSSGNQGIWILSLKTLKRTGAGFCKGVDIRVWSKERDLGSRRAGVRRFNSCSTHYSFGMVIGICGSVEILFFLYSFILCGSLENDPLSPPEGEATQGEHPPGPLFFQDLFQPYQELSQ
jgi:hypothetical protein